MTDYNKSSMTFYMEGFRFDDLAGIARRTAMEIGGIKIVGIEETKSLLRKTVYVTAEGDANRLYYYEKTLREYAGKP